MNTYYELLDQESGMLLKEYETERAAWEDLHQFAAEHGHEAIRGLVLLKVTRDKPSLVAMGEDLVSRATREWSGARQSA